MGKICTFFGHRDAPQSLCPLIKEKIIHLIENEDVDTFWIGGHGNFDKIAASILENCLKDYPFLSIVLVAAYPSQLHKENRIFCNMIDYPPEAETAPRRFAIPKRNSFMAHNTDFVISYVYLEYGGAYTALKIARHNNKTIFNLPLL